MYRFRLAAAASALAIAHMSSPALADDAAADLSADAADVSADAANSDTAVSADDAGADGMAEAQGLTSIVVTATKRETDLQQTPIAISVVTSS